MRTVVFSAQPGESPPIALDRFGITVGGAVGGPVHRAEGHVEPAEAVAPGVGHVARTPYEGFGPTAFRAGHRHVIAGLVRAARTVGEAGVAVAASTSCASSTRSGVTWAPRSAMPWASLHPGLSSAAGSAPSAASTIVSSALRARTGRRRPAGQTT